MTDDELKSTLGKLAIQELILEDKMKFVFSKLKEDAKEGGE